MKAPVKFIVRHEGQEVEVPFDQVVEAGLTLPPDNPLHAQSLAYATKLAALDRYPPAAHGTFGEAAERSLLKAAEVGLKFAAPKAGPGRGKSPVRRYMAGVVRLNKALPVPAIVDRVVAALEDEDRACWAAQAAGVALVTFAKGMKDELTRHRKSKSPNNGPIHQFVRRELARYS